MTLEKSNWTVFNELIQKVANITSIIDENIFRMLESFTFWIN